MVTNWAFPRARPTRVKTHYHWPDTSWEAFAVQDSWPTLFGSCVRHLRWGVALLVQMGLGSVCGVWGGGNCNPNIVGKWHVRLLVSFTCRDFYWLVVHSCFCGCAETTELRTVGCIRSSWFKPHHLSFVVGWIWEPWSVGKPRAQVVNQFKDRSSAECGCRMRMDEVD